MKTPFVKKMQAHPYVVFGVGMLTGALVVGLIFFFKVVQLREFESAVLRGLNPNNGTVQMIPGKGKNEFPTPPNGKNALPTPTGNKNEFPTPPNGKNALPTPTGN